MSLFPSTLTGRILDDGVTEPPVIELQGISAARLTRRPVPLAVRQLRDFNRGPWTCKRVHAGLRSRCSLAGALSQSLHQAFQSLQRPRPHSRCSAPGPHSCCSPPGLTVAAAPRPSQSLQRPRCPSQLLQPPTPHSRCSPPSPHSRCSAQVPLTVAAAP